MKVAIQFARDQEKQALKILLRHSPGMVLRGGIYVLEEEAVQAVRDAGISFVEVSRESTVPILQGAGAGERI